MIIKIKKNKKKIIKNDNINDSEEKNKENDINEEKEKEMKNIINEVKIDTSKLKGNKKNILSYTNKDSFLQIENFILEIINKNKPCCNCIKTKCMKKYCECYANNKLCKNCVCSDCKNKTEEPGLENKGIIYFKRRRKRR